MKIVFLCHGNICRSPMAEFVMKKLVADSRLQGMTIDSAALHDDAIGEDIHHGTRRKLEREGVPFSRRAAWLITPDKAHGYDYIVGMDSYNMADIRRIVYPGDLPKVFKLLEFAGSQRDIADPWYTGDFDGTFDDILEGCTALLRKLL